MDLLVNIDVDDLEHAVAFYTSAFDLRVGRRLFEGSVVELVGASSPLYLLSKRSGSVAVPSTTHTRNYARHWTPVHLDFTVDDMPAAVERATRAGAKLEHEIESFPWGELATLSDPFGHGFCLVKFAREGYGAA